MITLSTYDHHLIKSNQFFFPMLLWLFFFCATNLDWAEIYLLPHKPTLNTKLRVFQYKVLNNVLYLNKIFFRCGKVKSPLWFFCKSCGEIPVHFFSSCSLWQNIWSQAQVFFSNSKCQPDFMEEIQDEPNIVINHILLIYKHYVYLSRYFEV